jgi:hypothetical protein
LETVDNLISGEIANNEKENNNGDQNNENRESFIKRTTFHTTPIHLKPLGKILTVNDQENQNETNIIEIEERAVAE